MSFSISHLINTHTVNAFRFRDRQNNNIPYWRDVGTLDSYWQANMDLLALVPKLNLYDDEWPIWTYQKQLPPAKFVFDEANRRGYAVNSMISGSCIISGAKISGSLVFSNVRVNSYSYVEDSIILPKVNIGRHVRIKGAIIDRGCDVSEGTEIGYDRDQDLARGFRVSKNGIVLVTKSMLERAQASLVVINNSKSLNPPLVWQRKKA